MQCSSAQLSTLFAFSICLGVSLPSTHSRYHHHHHSHSSHCSTDVRLPVGSVSSFSVSYPFQIEYYRKRWSGVSSLRNIMTCPVHHVVGQANECDF